MENDTAWLDQDFYAVLGVAPDAAVADITAAYRRSARELHPDTNSDPAAEDRFKQVAAAYDVLRNPHRRAAYDRARRATGGARRRPGGGYTIRVDNLDHPHDRSPFGPAGSGSFFDGVFRTSPFAHPDPRGPARPGDPIHADVDIPFVDAIEGTALDVPVPGRGQVAVRIPAGVDEGQTIRMPGVGDPGLFGGPPGDLLVTVHVHPHHLSGGWARTSPSPFPSPTPKPSSEPTSLSPPCTATP